MSVWYPMSLWGELPPISIVSAKGDILYTKDGREIIDGIASWWTCIHGHRHPKIIEAIQNQIKTLDHVMLAGCTHEPAEELALKLQKTTQNQLPWIFYSDNGSNAVEIGLKIAHQYYKNLNPKTKKNTFIRFTKSYHGDSIGAMAVGGESVFNRIFRELTFPTKEYISPNCIRCPWGKKLETCNTECLDSFRKDVENDFENITGVILEPLINGANGMVFHSEKFLIELDKIIKTKGLLLILDEVFTGLYRVGHWYAFLRAGITPDIVAIAKGLTGGTLPLACTMVSAKIHQAFEDPNPEKSFFHGHTMTGNPIACKAAIASLEILDECGENLVLELELKLKERGKELERKFSHIIKDMRILGGVLAFEVDNDLGLDEYLNPIGRRLRNVFLAKGALIRPLGNTIYLTPSYHISNDTLDKLFLILAQGLETI